MLDELPDRFRRVLVDANIIEPQDVLAAGMDGLVALDGIGVKSAQMILEVAKRLTPEPAAPPLALQFEVITPDSAAGDVAREPAPAELPSVVVVRLAGLPAAVLGTRVIYQGEARQVPYHQLAQAQRQYPPGTFQVRLPTGAFEDV